MASKCLINFNEALLLSCLLASVPQLLHLIQQLPLSKFPQRQPRIDDMKLHVRSPMTSLMEILRHTSHSYINKWVLEYRRNLITIIIIHTLTILKTYVLST